ncbi:heavy metal translocating P-type ATPase [Pseudomonas mandelii]|uniref:heavy metal translocating P-type ATPase n=1 Tax=Pseudomonas mandelii TaxID=75612 RepID=UPI00398D673F
MNQENKLKPVLRLHVQKKEECCGSDHQHGSVKAAEPRHHKEHGHDHDHDHDHDHKHAHADACCAHGTLATEGVAITKSSPAPEGTNRVRYRIDKMDCPTEERLIRNRLEPMAGIVRLDFNLLNRELTVHHRLDDPQPIVAALVALDMGPSLLEAGAAPSAVPPALSAKLKGLLAISGLAAIAAEVIAWTTGQEGSWPVMVLAALSILSAGLPTLKKGWIAIKNFTLNIYFLMSLAVVGALVIGKWPEAAMVVFLFAIAEAIEALSLERARNAIKSLTALAPETAEVMIDGAWKDQPVASVLLGSRIRVRTGSRVPLDASVESGRAALDQAPITGESLPVDKQVGDPLYAGSIVTDGVVEATVTAVAGESTLARIAAAIQDAQAQRAPTQRFVDQFARYYTPAVVVLALLVAALGPVLFAGTWGDWLYQALVLLVIACPCALVVSTPITVVSGLAAAAKHGILIKGGAYLESGRLLKVVALDKTGTLTQGKPVLTDTEPFGDLPIEMALKIAASLDDHSTHPVAKALVNGWKLQQPDVAPFSVEDFGVLNGRGVKGVIDGQLWHLGNHRLVEELGLCSPALEARLSLLENAGKTVIVLCAARGPVAIFAVADTVRPESIAAVTALKALNVVPVMLTGDNPATAKSIAAQLGIQDARGNLMPEDKQVAVAELKRRFGTVGMVGDGVNDAPALAQADIGFAMGAAGTATALETADVAIMDDDPRKIADFISLSRRCASVLKQNIGLALGIKVVFLALALSGHATLWMAVFADMGASLLVVFNGLRLLRR